MVGTAAYLHDRAREPGQQPDFAVSLDMVGGHDGHLIIESSPDHLPSPIAAAFDATADAISPSTASYSTAVALPTWPRAVVPFVGASDHLLFADRSIAVPAAHIARWPDRWHHTSHDTTARLSAAELARTTLMTTAAITALCCGGDALTDVAASLYHHGTARLGALITQPDQGAEPSRGNRQHLDLVRTVIAGAYRTLDQWHPTSTKATEDWHRRFDDLAARLAMFAPPAPARDAATEPILIRCWDGPWNLHNLHLDLPAEGRLQLGYLLNDGGPAYARLVGLTMAINDEHTATEIIERAVNATGLHIGRQDAVAYLALLEHAGWLQRRPTGR